jgi:hypothetical protein
MSRGKMLALIFGAVLLLGAVGRVLHPHQPVHKSDYQLEQDAAKNLAAICTLKPEKC